ncbi:D-alanyl-D-alanine carboxypeptidase/D-alanyl-D-alanine-endopeptidase [Planctomonas deserti]|uniref:D-alanyl-D-alanine carboxypeptidase/D-alanyl-D-alanine-endopeptidase n=1 Tax=Planctomonas deserti TaxID=2144185 RepID=UPI0027D33998|nr:D-alanyl-D-alanine carboxypeptidase [Planctomonas deserti]
MIPPEQPPTQPAPAARRSRGLGAAMRRHPHAFVASAAATAFVLLGAGAVSAGAAVGTAQVPDARPAAITTEAPAPAASPSPSPSPTRAPRPVPAVQPAASKLRNCSIAALATDPRLASFQGYVLNAATGEVLFDRGGDTPERTASVMKVITSAAALTALGPDHRISTRVVTGAEPGTVVLVGGGDPTLSRLTSGTSVYPGAPRISDLAAQVRSAWAADPATAGTPITRIVLDTSLFSGPVWHPSWARTELSIGYSSEITALQVDADRADPGAIVSPRSEAPVARAGAAFADALGVDAALVEGVAPPDAAVLGEVQSQPVASLIKTALTISDNTLAETLARLVAIKVGAGNTQDALAAGIPKALEPLGLDTSTMLIVDGQGLSPDNRVPPALLAGLMAKVNAREGALGAIYDGLPVAGRTGTLTSRFTGDNAVARGNVVAKTGWIDTGYTLSGIISAVDGTPLTFAFYAIGNVRDNAKAALDTVTTGAYRCGNNLSNN